MSCVWSLRHAIWRARHMNRLLRAARASALLGSCGFCALPGPSARRFPFSAVHIRTSHLEGSCPILLKIAWVLLASGSIPRTFYPGTVGTVVPSFCSACGVICQDGNCMFSVLDMFFPSQVSLNPSLNATCPTQVSESNFPEVTNAVHNLLEVDYDHW